MALIKKLTLGLLACLMFATAITSCSKKEETGIIYGIVTDARKGTPIKEAAVELSPLSLKTLTDSDGWYQFSNLKSGDYKISVSKTSYKSAEKKGVSVEDGPVRCDMKLTSPSFDFGGHTYMVAPEAGELMTLADGISYCEELTHDGFSDWKMPTKEELEQMYIDKDYIGGFPDKVHWSSTYSSTNAYSSKLYYVIHFLNGDVMEAHYGSKLHVRPIRIEN